MCKELIEPIIKFFKEFPEPDPLPEPTIDEFPSASKFPLPGQIQEDYKKYIQQPLEIKKEPEWELV